MPGPYTIPDVAYGGDAPDPVEWANTIIKPAILDLDIRGLVLPPAGVRYPVVASDGAETVALQGGWMNSLPVWAPFAFSLSGLALDVIAGGSTPSTVKIGLYSIASIGAAGSLVHDFGTITTESSGLKTVSGGPWAIAAGLYMLSFLASSNVATVRAGGNQPGGLLQPLPLTVSVALGRRYLHDSGLTNLPSTTTASPSPNASEGVAAIPALVGVIA